MRWLFLIIIALVPTRRLVLPARGRSGFHSQVRQDLLGRFLAHQEITTFFVVAQRRLRCDLRKGQSLERCKPLVPGQPAVGNPPLVVIFPRQGGRGRVSGRVAPTRSDVEQIRPQNHHEGAFLDEGGHFFVPLVLADGGKRVRVAQELKHRHLNPLILMD